MPYLGVLDDVGVVIETAVDNPAGATFGDDDNTAFYFAGPIDWSQWNIPIGASR